MAKNKEEDKLKDIFSSTQIEAGENLKFRIMQQIVTEKSLSKATVHKRRESVLGSMFAVFGVMYIILLAIVGIAYSSGGVEVVKSANFCASAILVMLVGSTVCVIIGLDNKRKVKA